MKEYTLVFINKNAEWSLYIQSTRKRKGMERGERKAATVDKSNCSSKWLKIVLNSTGWEFSSLPQCNSTRQSADSARVREGISVSAHIGTGYDWQFQLRVRLCLVGLSLQFGAAVGLLPPLHSHSLPYTLRSQPSFPSQWHRLLSFSTINPRNY